MTAELDHFYHVYADGKWAVPVVDHILALRDGGLYDRLCSFQIGLVGSEENVAEVIAFLDEAEVEFTVCAKVREGWEQETLDALWEWSQHHDGLVLYAHTKGAANYAKINDAWRRSMEFHNVYDWRTPVEALENGGKTIAGCHWIRGNPEIERLAEAWKNRQLNPPGLDGVGGMFGGNYWWARLDAIRQNCRPDRIHRHAAEHWLGQLSEVMPIWEGTILDMNPRPIVPSNLTELPGVSN